MRVERCVYKKALWIYLGHSNIGEHHVEPRRQEVVVRTTDRVKLEKSYRDALLFTPIDKQNAVVA